MINIDKTEIMKCRREGHLAAINILHVGRRALKYVTNFKHLGMISFMNGQAFAEDITNRVG